MSQENIIEVWNSILKILEKEISDSTFSTWILPLEPQYYDENSFVVHTGQAFAPGMLRKNHHQEMTGAIKQVLGKELEIKIIYDDELAKKFAKRSSKPKKEDEGTQRKYQYDSLTQMQSSNLNLKYKFENFVVGTNNKLAFVAAQAVAKAPGEKYNPLYIYGGPGLGKTHLMQAIGHYIIFNKPKLRVKYIKTEEYVNELIKSIQRGSDCNRKMESFRQKYRNVDVLLIDDIQFIESKKRTMDEIFHTFDYLLNKNKQIVITSDRLPSEIPTLPARLQSRFEMGIMTEITPPDFETRVAILQSLADQEGLSTDFKVYEYIANNFVNNVRELEGAYNKVSAYAAFSKSALTLELVRKVLKCDEKKHEISFDTVAQNVAEYYGVTVEDFKSSSRNQKVSNARHVAVYLSREITDKSFEIIAKYFNKRHPTMLYSYDKIKEEIKNNKELERAVNELKRSIKG